MDRNIRTRIPETLVTTGDRTNENPIGLDILHIMIQNKFCTRFQFQFCFFVHTASLRRNRLTISRENFTKQLIRTMATNDTPNLTPNSSQFVKEEVCNTSHRTVVLHLANRFVMSCTQPTPECTAAICHVRSKFQMFLDVV